MATATVEPNKPELSLVPTTTTTPMELLRIATSQGADIDKLAKLMDLQERWEKSEARKAFVSAMNAFKASPPAITKNREVAFGNTKYSHATLDHVCDAVTKGLSEHGVSHRWKVEQDKEWIRVTCILTHEQGHSEETTLMGAPDNSGSKNSIQAVGSTVTYLQRYTLLAATGLAAGGSDNDGRGEPAQAKSATIPKEAVAEKCEWIANAKDLNELWALYKDAYKAAAEVGDRAAMAAYLKAKDARKREFQ